MRHTTTLLTATAALLLASGCGDALAFDLNAEVDEFTIPGDPHLHHGKAPLEAGTIPSIELQLGAVQPDSVSLSGLTFFVTDTSVEDDRDTDGLEFIESLEVYLVPADRGSGLPEIRVASWTGPVDPGTQEITLLVEEEFDLSPYLKAGFSLEAVTRGVVPYDDVSVSGAAIFRVNPI